MTSSHGMEIEANSFHYDKLTNILQATGDVKIFDKKNHLEIYTDKVTYLRNIEKIFTNNNSNINKNLS